MENRTRLKLVAVEFNPNGTCKKCLEIRNLTETEYKRLLNESLESREHGLKKVEEQRKELDNIDYHIGLNKILLAKSIYDNFVDRGLIEEDEELQKSFYDYIFENKEFEYKDNKDFVTILKKVRGA